jgi:hypothetical protein
VAEGVGHGFGFAEEDSVGEDVRGLWMQLELGEGEGETREE